MTFTKLDRGLLQSSVLAEDAETFKVWIVLLAACDDDGVARVSPVFVSSIARLPMDAIETAIKRLSSPDPASRSTVAKGRRIRRVDGGFEVINYHVYRSTSLRDAEAERKRLYRQRKKSPSDSPSKKDSRRRRERESSPDTVRNCPDNVRTPAPLSLGSKVQERELDKDGLLPIPRWGSPKSKDQLAEFRAEIRDDLRDLAQGKRTGSITRESVGEKITAFNQRVRDLT
jgi:hypothetical protein